jgi:hypothetical protein
MNLKTFSFPSSSFIAVFFISGFLLCFLIPLSVDAQQTMNVNQTLGDGKDGAVFAKWIQGANEQTIERVVAVVQKTKGGGDTFINLRFGENGATFENGKRVQLQDQNSRQVSWNVGSSPNGQPFVMNAYNGEVLLKSVTIFYANNNPLNNQEDGGNRPRGSSGRYQDDRRGGTRGEGRPNPRGPRRNDDWRGGPKNDSEWDASQGQYDYGNDQRYGSEGRNENWNNEEESNYDYGQNRPRSTQARCTQGRYKEPQIEIDSVQPTGGLFSGKYKVRGSIFGACLEETGYFEDGRKRSDFRLPPYSERFNRVPFELKVQQGRGGEIKVYSSNGGRDSVYIDDILQDPQSQGQGGGYQNGNPPFGIN